MARVVLQEALVLALLVLPAVLLPVDSALWGQDLRVQASVSVAAATPTPTPQPLTATLDVRPDSMQKRSKGDPVTAILELPSGYNVRDVNQASLLLCRGTTFCASGVPPEGKSKIGDADGDRIQDLKATFDRADVIALIADVVAPATVDFALSGYLTDGTVFVGSDRVRVVDPDVVDLTATPTPTGTPTASVTETETPVPAVTAAATQTPMETPAPTATETPTPAPSPTVVPSETPTASPSPTEIPTAAPTLTASPTATAVPSPTATHTPVPTATPTLTPTAQPTSPPTETPRPTPTKKPKG